MYDLSTLLKAVDLDILTESKSRLNLDTLITELNNNLSGGEIQRLSILKALLKKFQLSDPSAVPDEVTNTGSGENEEQLELLKALNSKLKQELRKSFIALKIAHNQLQMEKRRRSYPKKEEEDTSTPE